MSFLNETMEAEYEFRKSMKEAYNRGYEKGKADAALKWISVSEKLPENGRKVLVKADDVYYSLGQQNGVVIGWRNGNYWSTYTVNGKEYIRYPSKWMSLPELKLEEKE